MLKRPHKRIKVTTQFIMSCDYFGTNPFVCASNGSPTNDLLALIIDEFNGKSFAEVNELAEAFGFGAAAVHFHKRRLEEVDEHVLADRTVLLLMAEKPFLDILYRIDRTLQQDIPYTPELFAHLKQEFQAQLHSIAA